MKILIIHAHNSNRGDEAAVKAMVDELLLIYPDSEIVISNNGFTPYPRMDKRVKQIKRFPVLENKLSQLDFLIAAYTGGKVAFTSYGREFIRQIKDADIVLHAPGGPSIGDIYEKAEMLYLLRLNMVRRLGKPYVFYAPSMGPFKNETRNKLRKEILNNAAAIVVRDPISFNYVKDFVPNKDILLALDSAFQHDIDMDYNAGVLDGYSELKEFLKKHSKCIGVTITDLKWHPTHKNNSNIAEAIDDTFNDFIKKKTEEGYGIVFVPQLYGSSNDSTLMKKYCLNDNCFIVSDKEDKFDAYFQQYIISKLHAVVGMRYHSNIFSAKMGVPFISISYEQKMKGFMLNMNLQEYCIELQELSKGMLQEKFDLLLRTHSEYKKTLIKKHDLMKDAAYKTTLVVKDILDS